MADSTDLILPSQHRLFELDTDATYLNCAYMSPQLTAVQNAGIAGVKRKVEPWDMGVDMFFKDSEVLRDLAATLLGATADHIALTFAASYGIAVAAHNLEPHLQAGDNILVLAEQFPSNYYSWLELSRKKGAELNVVPIPEDRNWTQAIIDAINPKTRILALPNCHWTDGTLIDLVKIREAMGEPKEGGPFLVLDLTQSIGAYSFDAKLVQPDFITAALYKWGMSPYGSGLLYVAERFWDGDPIEHNWVNRYRSEDFVRLVDYCDEFQHAARRFDAGGRSNPVMMPMVTAAFRQLVDWRTERTHATLTSLTDYLADKMEDLPLECAAKPFRSGHMIGLYNKERWSDKLRASMADARIYVSYRGSGMRVSPHLHNTQEDMDTLLGYLRDHL